MYFSLKHWNLFAVPSVLVTDLRVFLPHIEPQRLDIRDGHDNITNNVLLNRGLWITHLNSRWLPLTNTSILLTLNPTIQNLIHKTNF